ncbi:hypothetical protein GINT2_001246 [Glugoides intestinalis]
MQQPGIMNRNNGGKIQDMAGNSMNALPNANNQSFASNVRWDLPMFLKFVRSVPEASKQLNALLSGYGVISPDITAENGDTTLPDTRKIAEQLEQAAAISLSFDVFVKKEVDAVRRYLVKSSMLITDYVMQLVEKYANLASTLADYRSTKSDMLKKQHIQNLFDLRDDSLKLIEMYNKVKAWRVDISSAISSVTQKPKRN